VLPFAGFIAGRDGTNVWMMVVASTIGSVGGAIVLYELGRRIGQERSRRLLARIPLTEPHEVDKAVDWFTRHGDAAVFNGRFIPVVRSLVSLPAGAAHMPRGRFILLSTVGTAIWNTVWVWAGYLLVRQWQSVARYSDWLNYAFWGDWLNYAFWGTIILLTARFVWHRRERITDTA